MDDDLKKRFGGPGTYWILQLIAGATIRTQEFYFGDPPAKRWLDDRFTFEQVEAAIAALLNYLRPRGKRVVPKNSAPGLSHDDIPKYIASLGMGR